MAPKKLPDGFSIRVAKLRNDGTVELTNGMTLADCNMTNVEVDDFVVDMASQGGKTTLDVRHKDGRKARFVHDGSDWYRVDAGQPGQRAVDSSKEQANGSTTSGLTFTKAIASLLAGVFRFALCAGDAVWRLSGRYPKSRLWGGGALLLLVSLVLAGLASARNGTEAGSETVVSSNVLVTRDEGETARGHHRPSSNEPEAVNEGSGPMGPSRLSNAKQRLGQLADKAGEVTDEARFKLTLCRLSRHGLKWDNAHHEERAMEVVQRIEANETAVVANERAIDMEIRYLCSSDRELTAMFYDKPEIRAAYVRLTGPQDFGRSRSSMAYMGLAAGLPLSGRPADVRRKLLHGSATAGDLFELAYIGRALSVKLGHLQARNTDVAIVLNAIPQDSQIAVNSDFARKFDRQLFNQPAGARLSAIESISIRQSLTEDSLWLEKQIRPLLGDYSWPEQLRSPTGPANSRVKWNADGDTGTIELSEAEAADFQQFMKRWKAKP